MVIASVAVNSKELKIGDPSDFIKHMTLNTLLGFKKKFGGKMILCCDANTYWRRDEYPAYKGHRKHNRDSNIDWDMAHRIMDELKTELRNNFPYIVLEVPGAEADDIIATLSGYFQENELTRTGLIEEPHQITIQSTDGDFPQLQKYRNVKQWNNVSKKFITCDNPAEFLIEHIVEGDTGDNVPNVMTGDWWSEARAKGEKTKANSVFAAKKADFVKRGYDACSNEEEQRNYRRNEQLVNLDLIPYHVRDRIIEAYITYKIGGSKSTVFAYLLKHRMKLLLASANDF